MKTPRAEIRKAFYQRLLDSLPIGPITASDVAWPNCMFSPEPSKMYIAPFLLFGTTTVASRSPVGFERLAGVFQVTAYGILNKGEAALEQVAQDLTDLFRGGTRLLLPDSDREILISTAYGSTMQIVTGGKIETGFSQPILARPQIVISANWQLYIPKGA